LSSIFNKLSFLFAKQVSESVFFSVDKVGFWIIIVLIGQS
jgi:hypothetical protein